MKQKNEGNFKSKKVLIAFMEFIIAIGCLIALVVMLTPKERITETSYSYSRPEEVSRYVVINEYITRIRPLTEYETFKTIAEKTLDSKIKVYSDVEKTKEITEGYISTGMIVETEEGEDYKANVIGDMTKNGDCNVAELTQIIRQIVGLSNLNEEQKLSADFNGDNIINITDVSMCINYIVYGEMEADKVPPEKPEIKIEGEGNKNAGWYRSEVKVEIEEKEEEKTEKIITTVEMEIEGERPRTQTTEEKGFKLSKEGRYKITSQSYGKNGTKSEVETKEIVIDKTLPEFISLEKEKVSRESYKLLLEAEDNKGIAKYKVIKDGEEQRVIAVDTKKEISEEITITENGRYKIIIEDVAGNEIEREINITDIEKDEKKYTITFLNYDGSVIETKIYREGETVQEPQTPTKPEDNNYTYTFIGWDKEITKAEKDETYTANYNKSYKNYCIVFKNEDGTQISKKTNYHYGDSVVLPEQNPSKEEDEIATYEFSGWDKEVTNVTENKEYTATYNKTYKNYTIIFKNDNGEILSEKTDYHYGDTVNVPIQNPSKQEDNTYTYEFTGWDKEIRNTVDGNEIYTAEYSPIYKNYAVRFKNDNGEVLSEKTDYHYGDSVILPESNPSKQEDETYTYEFRGWDKQVSNVTGNEEYTAKYNKTYKNYTVTFKDENGNVISKKEDYHYGDSVIKPAQNPSKEDDNTYTYTFVGWDKDVSNVDGNTTYTAVYDKKFIEYTVVFKQDTGEIINQTTYHYNEDIVIPEDPSKESTMSVAYKFIGWEPEVANKVTSNLEYTATYEEKEINYNFIFINDDETEIERRTYKYGESIEFPVAEKEDTEEIKYVFKNWNNISTESISDTEINITFKAEYKEEYYVARLEEKGELEGKSYFTLQEAIRNAGRVPRTIRMLKDVEEAVIVDDDQEITIDLNGKAITGTKTYVIKNYGNLSIEDNSENKEGKVKVTSEEEIGYGIHNREGTLTVKSGLVAAETSIEEGTTYAIYNQSEEKVTVEGGSILSEAKGEGAKSCGIYNQAGREIQVTGGVILGNAIGERSTTYGIYNETEGKVEVEEGTIQAKASLQSAISYGIYNKKSEEITITGGRIIAQSDRNIAYGVFNDEGRVTIGKTTNTLNKELEINVTANIGYGVYNNKGEILTANEQTVENEDLKITMIGTTSYGIYNNEGKIEVTTGNIELLSSTAYGIYNKKEMNVTGGKITTNATSSSSYGIYNNSNEDTNIENITLTGLERGIYNTKGNVRIKGINIEETKEGIYTGDYSNKVTIESGTIKAIRNGINNNKGTVILKDVEIESNQYGVYNTNNGITEIGEKGNNLSTEKPLIKGTKYGVYQELNTQGEIKFYDGKLEGEQAIYGGIGEIENNTRIVLTQNTQEDQTEQTAILEVIPSNNVAKIGDNYYTNLNDAIEAVEENKEETTTIEILTNQQLSEMTEIPENKKITIDLKGYELETYAQGGIINKGTLNIIDTNENEQNETTGKIISNIGIAISNEGNLNLTSGTITSNNYGIYNYNDGKVVVNGGTVEGKTYGIYNNSSNTQVEVNNGKVTSEKYGIGNDSNNSTTQNIKVTGGIVEGKETGIRNYYGTVNVEGGEVRTKGTNNTYAINSSYGQVNVTGGKVTNEVEGNTNNYSIYTTNSSLNITGGEIVGGVDTNETNLNIGTKDGTINTNIPTILGKEYGVKFVTRGSKQFNYYDGKIGGIIDSYSGNINEIEEDKEIQTREETINEKTYKVVTLVDEIEYENGIAKIGDTTYKKVSELRNAIANLNDNEQTEITIINDFETTRVIEVPNNKNVLIDLNGKEVRMSASMINRGQLEITDKTENHEGRIVNTKEAAIINSTNKELKITKGNIESVKTAISINSGKLIIGTEDQNIDNNIITIKGETVALSRNSSSYTVEMYDGTLIGKNSSQNIVDKTEEGYTAKTNKNGEYYETTIELEEPVARVGETDYYTVQEAIDNSNNGETVELLRTIDNQKTIIEIPEGKEITIDLKNYAINSEQEKTIINNGLLNVQNGSIRNSRSEGIVVENKGTLNVNSGSIAKTTYYTGTAIENKGILNVNDGTVQGYSKGIDNKEGATLTIKGGTIQARERAINNESENEINILGGTINYYSYYSSNNTYYGIYNDADSNINITGTAKIVNNNNNNQYGYGIYNNGKGNIVIDTEEGITISNSKYGYGIYNNGEGKVRLEKGAIRVQNVEFLGYGIKNASEGKVEIVNGKIEVQSTKGVVYGIENGVSGEVEILGGEIKAETQEGISYGINNISIPLLKVTGGKISAKGEQSYGIYNNSSDLQLGEKDNEVDMNNPIIESDKLGIFIRSIDSKFNFYDGKIIGKTAANVEATVEEGYKIRKTTLKDNREMIILMEQDSFIATFWNEDKTEIIAQVPFKSTDKKINEPTHPVREGYDGLWTYYEIKEEDIDIQLYYVKKKYNGSTYIATDKNGINWYYTYQDGKATNVYYESGDLGETVEIPQKLDGYEVISIYNTYNNYGYNDYRNLFNRSNYGTNYSIKKIVLPYTLTSIGNYAFHLCSALSEIDIPEGVTSIGKYAFSSCNLTELEIPNTIASIGGCAFDSYSITDIYINAKKEDINLNKNWDYGIKAYIHFSDSMHTISIENDDLNIRLEDVSNNLVDGKINCRENYQFRLLNESGETVKNKRIIVKTQGKFTNSEDICNFIMPNENGIYTIEKVNRDKVIRISNTMQNGEKFQSTDENGITWNFTYQDGEATEVYYESGQLGEIIQIPQTLEGCTVVKIHNTESNLDKNIFAKKYNEENSIIKEVILPNTLKIIGENAFYRCTNINNIEIPDSVTSIEYEAFSGCKNLNNINLTNNIVNLEGRIFDGCNSLTNIEIPNSITAIENGTFNWCIGLTEVHIPENVKRIECAFYYCSNLKDIYINNLEENMESPSNWTEGMSAFVHYLDCTHDIEKKAEEGYTINDNFDSSNEKITCHDRYEFTVIDNEGNLVTDKKVTVVSEGEFTYSGYVIEELLPNEEGKYVIENVKRNKKIEVGTVENGKYQSTDKNGITWNYTYKNGKATNVYYENGELGKTVEIPSQLDGYEVINIYNDTGGNSRNIFTKKNNEENNTIEEIILPNNVTTIGDNAFYYCTKLRNIDITNGITSIGDNAFYNCKSLTEIDIPDSVTNIGTYAFASCSEIESIELPNSITSIANSTFSGCSKLKNIEISNSLTSIGNYAFNNCTSLTNIKIPNSITSIGTGVFNNCSRLTDIYVDNTEQNIPLTTNWNYNAYVHYMDCKHIIDINNDPKEKIEFVEITNNLIDGEINCGEDYQFKLLNEQGEVIKNKTIKVKSQGQFKNSSYSTQNLQPNADGIYTIEKIKRNKEIIIGTKTNGSKFTAIDENGITWNYTYYNGKATDVYYQSGTLGETVEIPQYLDGYLVVKVNNTSAGDTRNIFTRTNDGTNTTIKQIILPDTLISIGKYAFYKCNGLTNMQIPNSVTSIEQYAFSNCTNLSNIDMANVTSIGHNAFSNCTSLIEIELPDSVISIEYSAFINCTNLTSIDMPNVTSIGNLVFSSCENLANVNMPNVISIGNNAFSYCSNLETMELSNTVTSIGDRAFDNCTNLTSIDMPNVTSIGNSVFSSCKNLANVNMPNVISIGNNAFYYCTSLESIEAPNVTDMGEYTFSNCTNLVSIDIPNVVNMGSGVFYNSTSLTQIEIPSSATSIGYATFKNCTNLTSVEILNGITSIGNEAFSNCSNLTIIEIPNSVTSMGYNVFSSCYNLSDIYIENTRLNMTLDSVWNYNNNAYVHFSDCKHSITKEITYEKLHIEDISKNLQDNMVICGESYKFKVVNEEGKIITDEEVKVISQGKYTNSENEIEELTADNDGVYTIKDINRNKIIRIGKDNGSKWQATDENGITWNYTHQNGKATNVYYESGELGETVEIPSQLDKYEVIGIYNDTEGHNRNIFTKNDYEENNVIKNIILPNSIKIIGNRAFNNCTSLTQIEIPNELTSIGEGAFSSCLSLEQINIPESITSIEYGSFSNCSSLTKIDIPDSVKSIQSCAFQGCSNLSDVKIANSVTGIGDNVFEGCKALESIEIPNSVNTIGSRVFLGCSALSDIYIDNSSENIEFGYEWYKSSYVWWHSGFGYVHYQNCKHSVTLSVDKRLTLRILEGNVENNEVDCRSTLKFQVLDNEENVLINEKVEVTSEGKFKLGGRYTAEDTKEKTVELTPDENGIYTVSNINRYKIIKVGKYYDGSKLETVDENGITWNYTYQNGEAIDVNYVEGDLEEQLEIPSILDGYQVTGIGKTQWSDMYHDYYYTSVFERNDIIKKIIIPEGIKKIEGGAFGGCNALENIEIPSSVINIENGVFDGCNNLEFINISENNENYASLDGVLFNKEKSILIKYPTGKKDSKYIVPEGIETIENNAFINCISLTQINIPDSVTNIGGRAFYNCTSLTNVKIGDSVTSIGDWAFYYCTSLSKIEIPNSVTSIGSSAFYDWTNNQTINICAESKPSGWSDDWNSNCSANIVWGYTKE